MKANQYIAKHDLLPSLDLSSLVFLRFQVWYITYLSTDSPNAEALPVLSYIIYAAPVSCCAFVIYSFFDTIWNVMCLD